MTNPSTTPEQGGMTWGEVMNLWVKAGGNPQAAAMAAAVADASSGLNPNASFTDAAGAKYQGLWQIGTNQGPLSTTDPLASARAAIQLSNNGTDFSAWCSAWSDNDCGNSGGSYLKDGSNALSSLKLRGGVYEVVGGQPLITDEKTALAQAQAIYNQQNGKSNSALAGATGSSGKGIILIILAGVLLLFLFLRRSKGNGKVKPPTAPSDKPEST